MAELNPHPHVAGTVYSVANKGTANRLAKATEVADAFAGPTGGMIQAVGPPTSGAIDAGIKKIPGVTKQELTKLGLLPTTPSTTDVAFDPPELVAFAGYLGPIIRRPPGGQPWRLLFLDRKLLTWLVVLEADIVFYERSFDLTAAYNMRDVILVESHSTVGRGQGSGAQSPQEWFLRGEFTDAGGFPAQPFGGTSSTAAVADAITPQCCGRYTR
jgi:hypothetical protein